MTHAKIPEPVKTGKPFYLKPRYRKPEGRETERRGGWVKTSVSLRASTRRRLKAWAAEHDMRIQEVVDAALETYLGLE